jgi:hypothetical protein
MTSRWAVDVANDRDVTIHWRPISLLFKNDMQPDSPWYPKAARTHGLLRIFEAVRAEKGEAKLGDLYTAYGRRIHHDQNLEFDPTEALVEAGLPKKYAKAMDDASWDKTIRSGMNAGLALTGNDVGTPILGFTNSKGKKVGFFGPVISRRLSHKDGLKLWDGIMLTADIDSFWELKRTRTESPKFGKRP